MSRLPKPNEDLSPVEPPAIGRVKEESGFRLVLSDVLFLRSGRVVRADLTDVLGWPKMVGA